MSSIFNLVPGLSKKMDTILQEYEDYYQKTYNGEVMAEDTSVNMSPYKDAINNTETSKKEGSQK